MKILQICAYAALHEGNFIMSLIALERKMAALGYETIYAFPSKAKDVSWCKKLSTNHRIYYLPIRNARILPKTYATIKKIYRENQDLNIVHSHFELYDMPATLCAPKSITIFWHLHDPIVFGSGIRSLLWKLQYKYVSRRVTLLSVADKYKEYVISQGFNPAKAYTILNGIDLNRISTVDKPVSEREYDFLTFGWDFFRKGDDLILQASERLYKEGYSFRLLLNGGEGTWLVLNKYLAGKQPEYLFLSNPVDNVNELFCDAKTFIQASRKETFSYAICEASYAGLPVIASDIYGLEWAHELENVSFFQSENIDELFMLMKSQILSYKGVKVYPHVASIIKSNYSIDTWADKIISYYIAKK